jgi:hypothetical protein
MLENGGVRWKGAHWTRHSAVGVWYVRLNWCWANRCLLGDHINGAGRITTCCKWVWLECGWTWAHRICRRGHYSTSGIEDAGGCWPDQRRCVEDGNTSRRRAVEYYENYWWAWTGHTNGSAKLCKYRINLLWLWLLYIRLQALYIDEQYATVMLLVFLKWLTVYFESESSSRGKGGIAHEGFLTLV